MLPIDQKKLRAEREQLYAQHGRGTSEARLRAEADKPTEPCTHCSARGCYAESADGARRPFDHTNFSQEKGDRFVACCPQCRGFKRIPCTPARAAYLARKRLREARKAYRRLRAAFCLSQELPPAHFDRLARKRLPAGDATPDQWLTAARAVAAFFGVQEVPRVAA